MKNTQLNYERLYIVDALRGFALFGILMLHSLEHFDLYHFPDLGVPFLKSLDGKVWDTMFFIFAGKSFALFAMMFGLSFYIQMESRRRKNKKFTARFLWRLVILFVLGVVNGAIYSGDVLKVLAVFGILLIFFDKLNNKILIVLSALFLLNIPMLYNLYQYISHNDYKPWGPNFESNFWGELWEASAKGSLLQSLRANLIQGSMASIMFQFYSSRYVVIPGLFIWGLILGRTSFFKNIESHLGLLRRIILTSLGLFIIFFGSKLYFSSLNFTDNIKSTIDGLLSTYSNVAFMVFLVSGFCLLTSTTRARRLIPILSPYGKMSLTNYVSMAVILIPIYYGYGLGLYEYTGATICFLLALAVFALQLSFSHRWLKNHHYGPLEWMWRCLTFLSFDIPFKKNLDREGKEVTVQLGV
ncbi:MAG TPA: DUF418 domain-containing protein [Cytophagaceae bacterium]|jgi:uncharacterized protein